MKTFIVIIAICIYATLTISLADGNKDKCDMKCVGKVITMNKELEDNEMKCIEEMRKEKKDNKPDRKLGYLCKEVCKFTKTGLIDDKGKPNKEKHDEILKSMMPEDKINQIQTNSKICFDNSSNLQFNSTDFTCETHSNFLHCIMKSVAMVCDEDYEEIDWDMDNHKK